MKSLIIIEDSVGHVVNAFVGRIPCKGELIKLPEMDGYPAGGPVKCALVTRVTHIVNYARDNDNYPIASIKITTDWREKNPSRGLE